MKIRLGFVSNSSSSSFVAWGVYEDAIKNLPKGDYYNNGFEKGGQSYDFIGLTVEWLVKNHPELPFGEVKRFVAEQLNKTFETNLTPDDITYKEEGWYDG